MFDKNKNNIEIGDIVRIENSPIKNDNALYVVAQDGTSRNYSGSGLTLYKVAKHKLGYTLSRSKYNICFYPITNYSNRYKFTREEMDAATIEIIKKADNKAFTIVKSNDEYEPEETEKTILYAFFMACDKKIEDVSYMCNEQEKMIAFFSNLTLKQDERIEVVKSDWSWNYCSKNIKYELRHNIDIKQPEAVEKQEIIETVEKTVEEPEPQPQQEKVIVTYYPINESYARIANDINSFSDYKAGSATETYKYCVNKEADIAEKQIAKYPDSKTEIIYNFNKYSEKLASWYNDYYRNEASCPSVMICGPANFPVRKKNAQNSRREMLQEKRNYIDKLLNKIQNIGTSGIRSGDKNAIEKLEKKISDLENEHKFHMYCNNYYKKNGTLKGCDGLTNIEINKIEDFIARNPFFPPFIVFNDTANIRRYKKRLEQLKKEKEKENKIKVEKDKDGNELFTVVENTEIMRLQLFFELKPDYETRTILKKNGFKWAPSIRAWQRQLTQNSCECLKQIKKELYV